MKCKGVLALLALLAPLSGGYRILCLFPFNGRSHFIMFDALCKGLARKGHHVDVISHFPARTPRPNYHDIVDLNGTRRNVVNSFSVDYAKRLGDNVVYEVAWNFGYSLCELMGHEKMQGFIKNARNGPRYDLVITEYFGASCYLGFGEFLKAPVALAISSLDMPYVQEFMRLPQDHATFPSYFNERARLATFWDRLDNAWRSFVNTRLFFYHTDAQNEIMRRYLGEDLPDIREMERRTSLVLTNTHHSFYGIRSTGLVRVEVGGLHVEEDESELTAELKSWLDSAEAGVVYFTLGSLINIETLPEKTILDIYASFEKIKPVKVLMKIANKSKLPPGLPRNVLTSSWIPQVPVLAHKNTRLFITHGGLMGSQEALHYGVPMIGIPVFADQLRNVNIFVAKGMAVRLEIDGIDETTLTAALNATLNDPSYRENAKRESERFRDRPLKPMEEAVYWIEYVIRHGPNSLRSPAADMPWWQAYLVDVFAFFAACIVVIACVLLTLIRTLIKIVLGTGSGSSVKKKTH